jgi:hypothetical protein
LLLPVPLVQVPALGLVRELAQVPVLGQVRVRELAQVPELELVPALVLEPERHSQQQLPHLSMLLPSPKLISVF